MCVGVCWCVLVCVGVCWCVLVLCGVVAKRLRVCQQHAPWQTNRPNGPRTLSYHSNVNASSPQAHACQTLKAHRQTHTTHISPHTHRAHATQTQTQHMNTPAHSQHLTTHTQHFRQNQDNIDCRHIDHLALHKVQAMELTKNMKTHNSQFGLCSEQHWLRSNMTAVCPRLSTVLVVLLVCCCLVDCRRCVACCTLTFTPVVETSSGYLQVGHGYSCRLFALV